MGPRVRFPLRILLSAAILLSGAASAQAQTMTLFFESQPGDSIGQGQTKTLTQADGTFTIGSTTNGVTARLSGATNATFNLSLAAPTGVPLTPGVYTAARRQPFTTFNGLDFSYASSGCNTLTGRFVVLEAEYGSGGTVLKFAADFEQHCNDATPALFGAIRYNSALAPTPFGGSYPSYTITIPAPLNGTVSSTGAVNCGTGGSACTDTFGGATTVNLTAAPDAGYIFAGWTDDCRGGPSTSVNVNGPKVCGARFELDASPSPRTLILFDSKPGDSVGGGKPQIYSDANSRITAQMNSGSSLSVRVTSIDATRDVSWQIELGAPAGAALTTGTFEGALRFSGAQPLLSVNFCSDSFGRFVVKELVRGSGTTVLRASVDLEIHCSSTDAGFFAAVRFNATDSTTVPFGGAYPVNRLSVSASGGGTVTGGGLTCGSGGAACQLNPSSPISVTLTAAPDAGHVFAGWIGGACLGGSPLTVRVNSIKFCTAVFEPLETAIPRTRAVLDYMAEARGVGTAASREAFSSLASQWTVTRPSSGRSIEFSVATLSPSGFTDSRRFTFSAPMGEALVVGQSYAAVRAPFATALPGLDVSSLFCSRLTGRFMVRELSVGSGGVVERAAIDFEHHCNDGDAALFGSIRFNTTLTAVPFDGSYPRYGIAMSRPAAGRVTGAGLDCSATATACQADFGAPANITLTASPDPGYRFAGWTGLCHGGETISFRLNTLRVCNAVFESLGSVGARALLKMTGQPGDSFLRGRAEVYSLQNSLWSPSVSSGLDSLSFQVWGAVDGDEARWSFTFRPATGQKLTPGTTYTNASSSFIAGLPVLQVSGGGPCSVTSSTFTVRELRIRPDSQIERAAVDFELHCDSISSPAVIGTIEYVGATDASRLQLNKSSLSFTSTSVGNSIGQTTAPQALRLSQSSGATDVSWTVATSESWLRVTPVAGSGSATLTVSILPAGLVGLGAHTATVTVSAGGDALPPVTVTWTVLAGAGSPPFGSFDTPLALTPDLTGAVALTGWALDDVEVTSVQIWRQPHPADPPAAIFNGPGPRNGKIFVGDATLVEGARPDVEAAFALPYRSRAGWGYMLLTRGLIWDGQGLFSVHAIATDRDGHTTEIGSTSFSVNNALATKPFGTIDTPGQGMTVSGLYGNTGWVLTPNPGASIAASNVRVMIDGVLQPGVPSVSPRSDITALFPAFDTSQAGRGLFIDTRTMTDGLHTIAWIVTDSTGQSDGIGSRFFQVANGGPGSLAAAARAQARAVRDVDRASIDAAPAGMAAIRVRTGFDPGTPFATLQGSSEPFAVSVPELERIEIRLPEAPGVQYAAYLRALGELRPLPVGSALDQRSGAFSWQPPAGFIGTYDVVFVARGRSGLEARYEVRITLTSRQE